MKIGTGKPNPPRRKTIVVSPESLVVETVLPDARLPIILRPAVEGVSLTEWARVNREEVMGKIKSLGAILFRGFRIKSIEVFEDLMTTLCGPLLDYSYRSTPRTLVSGKIYTSTEYPAHQTIPLHNEMSYSREWPMVLGFCCLVVAEKGGETPIADSRRVFTRIDPEIREVFARKKVMYVRNYGEALDLPWQDVFQTADRSQVEDFCRRAKIEFQWLGSNDLRTSQVCQAVATHPGTGEMVWFNQAHLFHLSSLSSEIRQSLLASVNGEPPRNAYFGDGSQLETDMLEQIRAAFEQEKMLFPWQQGDVMLVDNMLTAHGREPYDGARRIVVGMAQLCQNV